jgi:hypothetical protein
MSLADDVSGLFFPQLDRNGVTTPSSERDPA